MKRFIIWTQAKRLFLLFSESLKNLIRSYDYECETVYKFVNLKKFNLNDSDTLIIIGIQFFKIIPELYQFVKKYNKVIYSTEPLCCNDRLKDTKYYFDNFYDDKTIIWEYSKFNLDYLDKFNYRIKLVPFGMYNSYLNRINNNKKKIDFLFYGDLTKRRLRIKNKLEEKGYRVKFTNKLYDINKRNDLISKSKIVLDIFRIDNFECNNLYRLSYLLSNKVFVISEKNNCHFYKELNYVVFSDYTDLDNTCEKYIKLSNDERKLLAEKSFIQFNEKFNMNNFISKDYLYNLLI
jgi:hypothetical protein